MSTIQKRVARGRKATRTSTAPMLLSPSDRQKLLSYTPRSTETAYSPVSYIHANQPSHHSLHSADQSVSLYNLNDGRSTLPRSSERLSVSPPSWARTEVKSTYSLRQQLKEVMESITPSDSTKPKMQRHRRELTRCWSRERIIRSEVILSIRRPNGQSCVDLPSVGLLPTSSASEHSQSMQSVLSKSSTGQSLSPGRIPSGQMSSTLAGSNHSLFATSTAPVPLYAGRIIPIKTKQPEVSGTLATAFTDPDEQQFMAPPTPKANSRIFPASRVQVYSSTDSLSDEIIATQEIPSKVANLESPIKFADSASESTAGSPRSELTQPFDRVYERSPVQADHQPLQLDQPQYRDTQQSNQVEHYIEQQPHPQHHQTSEGSSSSVYSTASSSPPCSSTSLDEEDETEERMRSNYPLSDTPCPNAHQGQGELSGFGVGPSGLVTELCVTVKRDSTGYGLRVCGNKPVSVHSVRKGGTAEKAGLRPGDQIIKVNGELVEFLSHDDVVQHIRAKPTVVFLVRRQEYTHQAEPTRLQTQDIKPSRILTANEDPVLRSRSRRYFRKRRSSRESGNRNCATTEVMKRHGARPTTIVSAYEPLQSLHAIGLPRDSASDSGGPYTDEEYLAGDEETIDESTIQPRLDEETVPISESDLVAVGKSKAESSFPSLSSSIPSHSISVHTAEDPAAPVILSTITLTSTAANSSTSVMSPVVPGTEPTGAQSVLPGRVMGRNFDDNSDDDDIRIGEELVQQSALFEHARVVLENPARCGVFLNYLFTQNRDVSPALFYLVVQYFQYALRSTKDLLKEQRRLSIEIFTTFLHEKSPLRLDLPTPVVQRTYERIQTNAGSETFQEATTSALDIVQAQVSKLAEEIRHGMGTWKPSEPVNLLIRRNREEELAVFEMCMIARLQSLYQAGYEGGTTNGSSGPAEGILGDGTGAITHDQAASALCLALATAFRYFSSPIGMGPPCQGVSENPVHCGESGIVYSVRNSMFARSFENLNASTLGSGSGVGSGTGSIGGGLSTAGSTLWYKIGHFGTKMKQKQHSVFLLNSLKSKHSQKSHNLHQRAFDSVAECWACGRLLWGLAPQGLSCNNCNLSVHTKCKSSIRETCTKEGRRSAVLPVTPGANNGSVLTPTITSTLTETTTPLASNATITRVQSTVVQPNTAETSIHASNVASNVDTSFESGSSRGSIQYSKPSSQLPTAAVAESSPIPRPTNGSVTEAERLRNRSVGEEHLGQDNNARHVNRIKKRFESQERTGDPPSRSDSLASTSSMPLSYISGLDRSGGDGSTSNTISVTNDLVPELVVNDWSDDPEMIAGESFEAAVELQRQFPDYQMPAKGPKSEDYIRMLCLLEFHQKTQYMVRHLKQYDYLLLRCWPPKHERLARVLCLEQIPALISLFRTLVKCIDDTKTPQGYSGMAEAVYAWLTDNDGANLKSWSQHCQTLSCTNMLDCVRNFVREYGRRNQDILPLLQTQHNKFVLIDGLKQMRILYFNLPLIANNIVKGLQKTKSYKAEAEIWRRIHAKLASLPQTIDDVCMPLIKLINRGQLCTNLDKKDAIFRQKYSTIAPFQNLLLDFPRALFHYWVVAHAEVTVEKLTMTFASKVNHDYIREETDMLAIMLHNALMFLVKDNDRYVLRAFKVTREHGSGGGGGGGGGGPSSTSTIPSAVNVSNPTASATVNNGSDSRSVATTPGAATPGVGGSTDRTSFHLSSSSFSGTGTPSPVTPGTKSLSAATGSTVYSSISGGATATLADNHNSSPSLTATPQPSANSGGIVGAAANMAGVSLSDKPSGSGSLKLAPIFPLRDLYVSCGEKYGREHLLNIVSMDPPVLVRVLFYKEEQRKHWYDLLRANTVITANRVASLQPQQRGQGATSKSGTTTGATTKAVPATQSASPRGSLDFAAKPTKMSLSPEPQVFKDAQSRSHEPDSEFLHSPGSIRAEKGRKNAAQHRTRISATAPAMETSGLVGSMEDLVSPIDPFFMGINRLIRSTERIRPLFCESDLNLKLDEPEQPQSSQQQSDLEGDSATLQSKPTISGYSIVTLLDLTRDYLGCLSHIVARMYLQRQQALQASTNQQDLESTGVPIGIEESSPLKKRSGSVDAKRQSSLSWTEHYQELATQPTSEKEPSVKSATPPPFPSTPRSMDPSQTSAECCPSKASQAKTGTLTSSTPNLLQIDASTHPSGRSAATMKVHDLRRSKRGCSIRATSVPHTSTTESEQMLADRIRLITPSLALVVRYCQQFVMGGQTEETEATMQQTELPIPTETTHLDFSSNEEELDMNAAELAHLGDSGSHQGFVESDEVVEEETFHSDDNEYSYGCDEALDKADTLRPTHADDADPSGLSPVSFDAASHITESVSDSNVKETDGPTSSTISAEPGTTAELETDTASAATLLGSSGIRDSGCVPSITDEDDETLEESLDIHQRSSTPLLDTEPELTPTASSAMTDQLLEQITNPDVPAEVPMAEESHDNNPESHMESIEPNSAFGNESSELTDTPTTSVGRTDSQKSTTSSGFVGSGDD